jgi:hypothetical protein
MQISDFHRRELYSDRIRAGIFGAGMPTIEERERYARRAMELRAMAETVRDPDIKETLETMVTSYDKLVEEADRIARMRVKVSPA